MVLQFKLQSDAPAPSHVCNLLTSNGGAARFEPGVEVLVIRPWLTDWASEKAEIAADLERAAAAKTPATRTKRLG